MRESDSNVKGIILKVYLQPRSSKNEIVGPYREGIKIKITAPPVEGKANEALIRFLAGELEIPPSWIEILKGHHSREKTVRVSGISGPGIKKLKPSKSPGENSY
ncbi:MAG: DUF167 domain-containing protein [Thermodesulfobacteriota bacterium]